MSDSNLLVTNLLKNSKDSKGNTLYDHLSSLIAKMPLTKTLNNYQHFELLSAFEKQNKFQFKQLHTDHQIKHLEDTAHKKPFSWVDKVLELVKTAKNIKKQENLRINNFCLESSIFEWVGISFSRQQAYKIHQSIKRLASISQTKKIRFWGKILTKKNDYFVAQGISQMKNHTEIIDGMEKVGEGINYYTFWVTHNYLSQWYQLPLITPQHILTARKIKHIFTGQLSAPVKSYPIFMGLQKHLLKAQLVRITHACEIAPKGMFTTLQQNPDEIDFAEDFKYPEFAQLSNLQNWVHLNQYLLQQGRCSYYVDSTLPEQQREQALTQLNQKDPKVERLKGINQDKPVQGFQASWIVKTYGDTQIFNNIGKQQGSISCYGIVSLKNLNWPGWITATTNKSHSSIYIGYGIKSQQALFYPIGPNDLQQQGNDNDEFGEPNPTEPPDQIQPDSDDDKKKQESE